MTVQVDPSVISMTASIRAAAQAAPMLCLTGRAFNDLAAELGGHEATAEYLLALAAANNRPLAVNYETGIDRSSTAIIAPRAWTEERLAGWAAGHHQELERQFGQVASVRTVPGRPNRAERRRRQREG